MDVLNVDPWSFIKIAEAAPRGALHLEIFKKGVLKNFTIFTGKRQCWSLFL